VKHYRIEYYYHEGELYMYKIMLICALAFTAVPVAGAKKNQAASTVSTEQALKRTREAIKDIEGQLEKAWKSDHDKSSFGRSYINHLNKALSDLQKEEKDLMKKS
jgi:hypothetical protein